MKKEILFEIASLPKRERKQAITLIKRCGEILDELSSAQGKPVEMRKIWAYTPPIPGINGYKKSIREMLSLAGTEFSGGQNSPLLASIPAAKE